MDKEYLYNNTLDKYQDENLTKFVTENEIITLDRIVETDLEKHLGNWGAHPYKNGWSSSRT